MLLLRLLVEMCVVGATLVVVSLALSVLQGESLQEDFIWPMVHGVFLTGAATHFLFEAAGVNAWYAKEYKPIFT